MGVMRAVLVLTFLAFRRPLNWCDWLRSLFEHAPKLCRLSLVAIRLVPSARVRVKSSLGSFRC